MDISNYMTMKCSFKELLGLDDEFRTPTYGEEQERKCFKYGDKLNVLPADGKDTLSAMTYLLDTFVKVGDLVDGYVVSSVCEYPSFDGNVELYEVRVVHNVMEAK